MKKNQKFGREEIINHLQGQRSSNLTVSAYCEQLKISTQSFCRWRKLYENSAVSGKFISLQLSHSSADRILAQINHPKGLQINFYSGVSPEYLAKIISLL